MSVNSGRGLDARINVMNDSKGRNLKFEVDLGNNLIDNRLNEILSANCSNRPSSALSIKSRAQSRKEFDSLCSEVGIESPISQRRSSQK